MSDTSENYLSNLKSLEDELARMARELDLNITSTEEGTVTGTTTVVGLDDTLGNAVPPGVPEENESESSSSGSPSTINPPSSSAPDSLAPRTAPAPALEVVQQTDRPIMDDLYAALGLDEEEDEEERGRETGYLPTGDSDGSSETSRGSAPAPVPQAPQAPAPAVRPAGAGVVLNAPGSSSSSEHDESSSSSSVPPARPAPGVRISEGEMADVSSGGDRAARPRAPLPLPQMPPTLEGRAEAGLRHSSSGEDASARVRARAAPRPFLGAPNPDAFGSQASSLASSQSGNSLPPSHSPSVTRPSSHSESRDESQPATPPSAAASSPVSSLPSLARDALVPLGGSLAAGLGGADSRATDSRTATFINTISDLLGADTALKITGSPIPSLGDELRALRTLGAADLNPPRPAQPDSGVVPSGVRALNAVMATLDAAPPRAAPLRLPAPRDASNSADSSLDSIDDLGQQLDALLPQTKPVLPAPAPAHEPPADVTRRLEQGLEKARAGLEEFKRQFASVLASPTAAQANPTPGLSPVNPVRAQAAPAPAPTPAAVPVSPLQPLAEVEDYLRGVREKYGALLQGQSQPASQAQTPAKAQGQSVATETQPRPATVSRAVSAAHSQAHSHSHSSAASQRKAPVYEDSSSVSTRASSKDAAAVTPLRSRGPSGLDPSEIPEYRAVPIPVTMPASDTHSAADSRLEGSVTSSGAASSQRRLSFSGAEGGKSRSNPSQAEQEHEQEEEATTDVTSSSASDQGAPVLPTHVRHSASAPQEGAFASQVRLTAVNALLRDCGFSGILAPEGSSGIEPDRVVEALTDVLGQYQRRSRLVQELLQAQELERQREARVEQAIRELQVQRDEAEGRARKAVSALEAAKQRVEKQEEVKALVKKVEAEAGRLRARLAQTEHLVKAKEQEADKVKLKLEERIAREERRAQRDREIYDKLKRAYAAAGGKENASPRSPSMNVAVRELKPLEIVSLYEAQRETLELELASLRSENRTLRDDLREAQNLIARKDRTKSWANPAAESEERLVAAERRVAELARELAEERAARVEEARKSERRLAESERKAESLAEENASLVLEIEARPSVREAKSLQRQVDILERKLAALRSGKEAGQEAETAEVALGVLSASNGASAALPTRDRIRRDREVHRLGLRHVEQLPRDVLVDLVQDACIALEVSDATVLGAQLARVIKCVSALPKLERFASEVCDVVLRLGAPFLPPQARGASVTGKDAPLIVPRVLREWLQSLQLLQDHRDLLTAVRAEMARRPGGGLPLKELSVGEEGAGEAAVLQANALVLQAVKQLVDVERAALGSQETVKATEGLLASQPDVLAHRILTHFMHLFDCPRLEGVLPRMNQVYVGLNEARNFQRSLGLLLGFQDKGRAAAIVAKGAVAAEPPSFQQLGDAVRKLVQMGLGHDQRLLQALHDVNVNVPAAAEERKRGPAVPSGTGPMACVVLPNGDVVWESKGEAEAVALSFNSGAEVERDELRRREQAQDGDDKENQSSGVPSPASSLPPAPQPQHPEADAEMAAYVRAMREVLALLRVDDLQEALHQLERVLKRLYKLDEALPRYQGLVRRLYDVLRVNALDEIIPAVENMTRVLDRR